jgi:hypothetical protein
MTIKSKMILTIAAVLLSTGLAKALAQCADLVNWGSCPTLAPTVGNGCFGNPMCQTYYTYSAAPMWAIKYGNTYIGCVPAQVSIPYTKWTAGVGACTPPTWVCGYVGAPRTALCDSATCDDVCP